MSKALMFYTLIPQKYVHARLFIYLFICANYTSHVNYHYDEFDSPRSNIPSLREVKNK